MPGVIKFPVNLSAAELSLIRGWIAQCHKLSASRSHIKDEGFVALGESFAVLGCTSETGAALDGDTLRALARLVAAFAAQLKTHFPAQHEFVDQRAHALQFNVLSYKAPEGQARIEGVPYHSDRVPTTIIFNFLATGADSGGELEVLDLDDALDARDSGNPTQLCEENWAVVFDDRACLHRVHSMTGRRQALTLRVWELPDAR
jgi:hypothetical protein